MKILCGTDFSLHAAEAGRAAAAIAARLRTELLLVHVHDNHRYSRISSELYKHLQESRQARLDLESKRLESAGVIVKNRLIEGSPAGSLVDAATDAQAGLIVVSSLGEIAPSRWFIGSVAERTAQNAAIATLVVRNHHVLEKWANGESPLNVLVAYDFSPSGDAALGWAASLVRIGRCNFKIIYVAGRESEQLGASNEDFASPGAIKKLIVRDLEERAKRILGEAKFQVEVFPGIGRPDPQLVELAQAGLAELIVVGTNQKRGVSLLGSVSRGVLHHATTNVACVPIGAPSSTASENLQEFRKVLVPTDFSPLANHAIPFAYSLARNGGEVSLLHVGCHAADALKGAGEDEESILSKLRDLAAPEAAARGISTRVEYVKSGNVAEAIREMADKTQSDAICISSHGSSVPAGGLLGATTRSVLELSRVPVLVVPQKN